MTPEGANARLRPYVASLALTWLRDTPHATWREVDGSLVFVDISGFTRLTERLADRGKGGAEEMSDILDVTFGELLSVAYAYGAQLVKWGGDAVLLLFNGEDHAPRSCRAAYDMRRTMSRVGRLKTSAGSVTLRMSVGIHSGTFHFFLVGTLHHELIITGPGATEAARIEGIAEAGEIGISPATAALLDPAVVGDAKEPGVLLLRRAPKVTESPRRTPLDLSGIDVAGCLTAPTREHLLAGGTDGEHRQISVAFVEFKQTDDLLAEQGPGALAAALHHVVSATQEACARHGVTFWETDISPDGGKVMLVGGAPRSTDDDAGAMLATARDLMDAGGALPVRIGVNYGRVFSGDFGPDYRRTFSVKGDAVNLAARVMGKSSAGEIWATETILEHSRLAFDAEPLEPFLVKGKLKPVQAYRLGQVRQASAMWVDEDLPLVGRDGELATLGAAVSAARDGNGSLVEVVGEPGIGKSRLLSEVRQRCPDMRQIGLVCDAYHSTTPYAPFRTLLRELLDIPYDATAGLAGDLLGAAVGRQAPHLADWLPLIAVVADADVSPTEASAALDEKFRKRRLEQATTDLLESLLPTPTLVVVEDVHLVDDASADLLTHVAGRVEGHPWAVVVSRRTTPGGFAPAAPSARVDLLPLDEAATRSMLATATESSPLRPHELAALSDRADGNPLFLLQLLDAVRRTGSMDGLPDSVEGVITARIDRLPPADRRQLRAAAVLGVRFELSVLSRVLELDGVDMQLGTLGDYIQSLDGGMAAFRHGLVRDTAYEGLPFTRRRELHGRAGQALETMYADRADERADLLSLHFHHAEDFDRAWRYACTAGQRAQAAYAYVEAAVFYERGLSAGRRLATRDVAGLSRTWESLGDVRLRLGEFVSASEAYREARSGYRDQPVSLARVQFRTAQAADLAGEYPRALRWMSTARRVLDHAPDDPDAGRLRAEISGFYGLVRHRQGNEHEAVRWCEQAINEAEAANARDALAAALVHLDISETMLGRGEGAHAARGLEIWRELGDAWQEARACNALGIRAYFAGRWDEASQHYDSARLAALRAGDEWMATLAGNNLAEVFSDQGRLDQAEVIMVEALRTLRATGAPAVLSIGQTLMARLRARQGDFDAALDLYAEARALQEADGEQALLLETHARIAECLAWQGSLGPALKACSDALERARSVPGAAASLPLLHRVRGMTLGALGDLHGAMESLRTSIGCARQRDAVHEVMWGLDALLPYMAVVGDDDTSVRAERDLLVERLGVVALPPTSRTHVVDDTGMTPAQGTSRLLSE